MSKEHIEVLGGGQSAIIDDFRSVSLFRGDSNARKIRYRRQDKGQAAMLSAWLDGLRKGKPCIDSSSLIRVSAATVMAVESLATGMPLNVDDGFRVIPGQE